MTSRSDLLRDYGKVHRPVQVLVYANSESAEITMSVPLENCEIIRVLFSILARQYNRAASILAGKEQNIISDPGKGDNLPRYVANESVNAHLM